MLERAVIVAEAGRKWKQINAKAERVIQDVRVEAARIHRQAEAEGEAAKIRQRQIAMAEEIIEQTKARGCLIREILWIKILKIIN